ncbi:MAG: 3-deoxy-manno-octulosonate cytidylyltransferase [Opitutales bacterium]|nr:3-deoxy-manno-octulosonate cytidylyltransferase [Opitutales bacterium]
MIFKILLSIIKIALWTIPACFGIAMLIRSRESYEDSFVRSTLRQNGMSIERYIRMFRLLGFFLFLLAAAIFYYFHLHENIPSVNQEVEEFFKSENSAIFRTAMLLSGAIAIPTRMGSTRFPGKPLARLGSKRVLEHVYEKCLASKNAQAVFILTDSPEIDAFAKTIGAKCIMTSPQCQNGTERIVEALEKINAEFIVNVQGDEPFIPPSLIDSIFEIRAKTNCEIATAATPITDPEELFNPNNVKVLTNAAGQVIYFSRSPLPYVRGEENPAKWLERRKYLKHIGIYGYSQSALKKYASLPKSSLESCESLEQLRFIDAGIPMALVESGYKVVGIDTPEDLRKAEEMLNQKS